MALIEEFRAELKNAMRARDQQRLDALRLVETEVGKAKTAPGFEGDVDDALYERIIGAYVKKMKKALKEYQSYGDRGKEMAEKLSFEVDYLGRWLPKGLDEAATRELVRKAIADLGVESPREMGKVMGQLMKQHKGQIDGSLVSKLVKEELA